MMKTKRQSNDSTSQVERFMEAARSLECDEDKEKFEAQLGKIAAHKHQSSQPEPKTKTKPRPKAR